MKEKTPALAELDSQALDALVKHILNAKQLMSKIVFAWLKENSLHVIDDKLAKTLLPHER